MKLLIGADLVPTESNYKYFSDGNAEYLFGDSIIKLCNEHDYKIINLEVPLCDEKHPIDKCGPNLIAPKNTIKAIKNLGVNLCSLANNHIMDQGEFGLYSTLETLEENNIGYVGVGKNISELSKVYFFEKDNIKIGIYSCCEHEFSVATEKLCGANPYEPLSTFEEIKKLSQQCDYLIVLFHGGKEHYRYPSPNLQKICRKLIDSGACCVITQHSHCIGCKEEYNNGTILYGQGNFIFDHSEIECWQTGLLVSIEFYLNNYKIEYIPLVKDKEKVRLATSEIKDKILNELNIRSNEILQTGFVYENYIKFSQENIKNILLSIKGINQKSFIFRLFRRLFGEKYINYIINRNIDKSYLYLLLNRFKCEAWSELINVGIEKFL